MCQSTHFLMAFSSVNCELVFLHFARFAPSSFSSRLAFLGFAPHRSTQQAPRLLAHRPQLYLTCFLVKFWIKRAQVQNTRPLICISLNKNSDHCYFSLSQKPHCLNEVAGGYQFRTAPFKANLRSQSRELFRIAIFTT